MRDISAVDTPRLCSGRADRPPVVRVGVLSPISLAELDRRVLQRRNPLLKRRMC